MRALQESIDKRSAAVMKLESDRRCLLTALKEVECSLGHSPEHNRWDLGPSKLLLKVRRAIAQAEKKL